MKKISIVVVIGLLIAGIYYWQARAVKSSKEAVPQLSALGGDPTPSPEPTTGATVSAQPPSAKPQSNPTSLEDFLRQQAGTAWTIHRSGDGGAVKSMMGRPIATQGKGPAQVEKWLQQLSPYLGSGTSQLRPTEESVQSSPKSTAYGFDQHSQGFKVYDSWVRVFTRKDDGAIYMVNNRMQPVDPVNTEIELGFNAGKKKVEELFGSGRAPVVQGEGAPQIYAKNTPHELVWQYDVQLSNPFDRRIVVVGITSKTVRENLTIVKN